MKRAWQRFSWPVALTVTAALACLATVFVVEPTQVGEGPGQPTLQATMPGASRACLVHMPDDYEEQPTRRYPIIYAFLRADPSLVGRLLLKLGSRDSDAMTQAFRSAIELLRMHAPPGLLWRAIARCRWCPSRGAISASPRYR